MNIFGRRTNYWPFVAGRGKQDRMMDKSIDLDGLSIKPYDLNLLTFNR